MDLWGQLVMIDKLHPLIIAGSTQDQSPYNCKAIIENQDEPGMGCTQINLGINSVLGHIRNLGSNSAQPCANCASEHLAKG